MRAKAYTIPEKAAQRAAQFIGRKAALERIDDWLAKSAGSEPWLLLTGDPGTGKSALLAWLAGAGPAPLDAGTASLRSRIREAIDVVHFCDAEGGRAAISLDPFQFAQQMVQQLSKRFPDYAQRFLNSLRINLNIHMSTGQAETVIGPRFGDIHGQPPAALFNCVLGPLAEGGLQNAGKPVVILVDALDEATLWRDEPKITELLASVGAGVCDSGVRFLLSSRPVTEVIDSFPKEAQWDLIRDGGDDAGDVSFYAKRRFVAMGHADATALAQKIDTASRGNFLYAKCVLDFFQQRPQELANGAEPDLPAGLDGMYSMFLQREYGAGGDSEVWMRQARPLLGTIGVAMEKLTDQQLRWILEPKPDPLGPGLVEKALPRCLQYLDGDLPGGPFGIYHQSFREFLFERKHGGKFATQEWVWHGFVAKRFSSAYADDWTRCQDPYGLRHVPTHLFEAACNEDAVDRDEMIGRLVELTRSSSFRAAHTERFDDPIALLEDMRRAVVTAALEVNARSVPRLLESALGLEAYRRDQLQPARIFELAREGDLAHAEKRLDLFSIERHWRQGVLLICAWLAAASHPKEARALCERLSKDPLPHEPLPRLFDRVMASLEGQNPPLAALPAEVPHEVVNLIVNRMKGIDPAVNPSMLGEFVEGYDLRPEEASHGAEYLTSEASLEPNDHQPVFLAERESPLLVSYAVDHATPGDAMVAEYIQLHAANNYELYRNRSLWGILKFILRHPGLDWARDRALEIAAGALAGSGLRFREALPLTLLALSAQAGIAGSRETWDCMLTETMGEAQSLRNDRGAADAWGQIKRRLGAVAEIESRVYKSARGNDAITTALALPFGFAGFQSPACLALAESIAIVDPHLVPQIDQALDSACEAAHNVQDPVFCARTTSRYNAMRSQWWGPVGTSLPDFDPVREAEQLAADPGSPRYAPTHIVGEAYEKRRESDDSIRLPEACRHADSLHTLADRVYQQPLTEFRRLNRRLGVNDHDVLPPGARIQVPDPGFRKQLAGRFAAELLRREDLPRTDRLRAMQRLVPVAAARVTALDSVLARLIMLLGPEKPDEIRRLVEIRKQHAPEHLAGETFWRGSVGGGWSNSET